MSGQAGWLRASDAAAATELKVILIMSQLHNAESVFVLSSGKSSLLAALLGEMEQQGGHCRLNGRAAYVGQQAWVMSGSFRQVCKMVPMHKWCHQLPTASTDTLAFTHPARLHAQCRARLQT